MVTIPFIVIVSFRTIPIGLNWLLIVETDRPQTLFLRWTCKKPARSRRMKRERGVTRQCGWIWHWTSNKGELPAESQPSTIHTYYVANLDSCPCIWGFLTTVNQQHGANEATTPPFHLCTNTPPPSESAGWLNTGHQLFGSGVPAPFAGSDAIGPQPPAHWSTDPPYGIQYWRFGEPLFDFKINLRSSGSEHGSLLLSLRDRNSGALIWQRHVVHGHDLVPDPLVVTDTIPVGFGTDYFLELNWVTFPPASLGIDGQSYWLFTRA